METLVDRLESEQKGWNGVGGGRSLLLPSLGGLVIRPGMDSAFAHVVIVAYHVVLNNGGSQLKIRVGDATFGVFGGDQVALHGCGEAEPPY
jgi:hypothetical protein